MKLTRICQAVDSSGQAFGPELTFEAETAPELDRLLIEAHNERNPGKNGTYRVSGYSDVVPVVERPPIQVGTDEDGMPIFVKPVQYIEITAADLAGAQN